MVLTVVWKQNLWLLILIPAASVKSFSPFPPTEYFMYGMPLWRLVMSEQDVPAARDDLACEMPTQQTAHPSAMNADK